MKKFILLLGTALLMTTTVFASSGVEPKGDDLFPWPWGTECPFPWQDIQGGYYVRAVKDGPYNGHMLYFQVKKQSNNSTKYLEVSQYNRQGVLFATGKAYTQKDQRIAKGVLRTVESDRDYVVMIRSYMSSEARSCKKENLVTAITFCPMRGRKCLQDANYVLVPSAKNG